MNQRPESKTTRAGPEGGLGGVAPESIRLVNEAVRRSSAWISPLRTALSRVVVGHERLVERLLIALLADGHLLLEGGPGLAKSSTLKAFARAVDAGYRRIRFSADMRPEDLLGPESSQGSLEAESVPVFSNLILADEIEHAPARVRNALFEVMQERRIRIGGTTLSLPTPFMVVVSRCPIDGSGVAGMTPAQADRFLMKISVGYPSEEEEQRILDLADVSSHGRETAVLDAAGLAKARQVVYSVHMDDRLKKYVISLVLATRAPELVGIHPGHLQLGASPRATLSLMKAAKALAFILGRGYVTPQDVKLVAIDVMRHRVRVAPAAKAEGIETEDLLTEILETVPVP